MLRLLALLLLAAPTAAQPLLSEDFEGGGFPPDGWAVFDNGVATEASWVGFYDDDRDNTWAFVPEQSAPAGQFAEDYLATPALALTADAHTLSFDAAELFQGVEGGELAVLVSTGSQTDPDDYAAVATFTEKDFGPAPTFSARLVVDLGAYAGQTVYVAFRVRQNGGDGFFVDNVVVGPDAPAFVEDVRFAFQYRDDVQPGSTDNPVIVANVRIGGTTGTATLEAITFTTEGTTDPADIAAAQVTYTGQLLFEGSGGGTPFGASIADPSGQMAFTGSQELVPGNNYVVLLYDVAEDAGNGNRLDAAVAEATVEGVTVGASVGSGEGSLRIPLPLDNDDLADARPLEEPTDFQMGTNVGASSEADETIASCGLDGGNSVYWSFTAPSDGTASISLAGSDFPPILSVQRGDGHPLTELICAFQNAGADTALSDLPVEAGMTYYFRVTGNSGFFGVDEGEIHVTFSFSGTTAAEPGPAAGYALDAYPNPFAGTAIVRLRVAEPQPVTVAVFDALGRWVTTLHDGPIAAGTPHRLTLDGAALPAGPYIVRVEGASFREVHRLTLVR